MLMSYKIKLKNIIDQPLKILIRASKRLIGMEGVQCSDVQANLPAKLLSPFSPYLYEGCHAT